MSGCYRQGANKGVVHCMQALATTSIWARKRCLHISAVLGSWLNMWGVFLWACKDNGTD